MLLSCNCRLRFVASTSVFGPLCFQYVSLTYLSCWGACPELHGTAVHTTTSACHQLTHLLCFVQELAQQQHSLQQQLDQMLQELQSKQSLTGEPTRQEVPRTPPASPAPAQPHRSIRQLSAASPARGLAFSRALSMGAMRPLRVPFEASSPPPPLLGARTRASPIRPSVVSAELPQTGPQHRSVHDWLDRAAGASGASAMTAASPPAPDVVARHQRLVTNDWVPRGAQAYGDGPHTARAARSVSASEAGGARERDAPGGPLPAVLPVRGLPDVVEAFQGLAYNTMPTWRRDRQQ